MLYCVTFYYIVYCVILYSTIILLCTIVKETNNESASIVSRVLYSAKSGRPEVLMMQLLY